MKNKTVTEKLSDFIQWTENQGPGKKPKLLTAYLKTQ